ncbi:RHS repeat-associated core domain-containing protein [Sorangium sp. KYC3313]|uniref:RHS repeat-associated core domain-containing protein n=1 Tax=Sorangium sp. KYC3313 TaxID=3449740 RepID=UPI003F8A3544
MARTAPVPNIPAIPGMNPGVFIMGGGGAGGGGGGAGGSGSGGKQGGNGSNGGKDASGGGKSGCGSAGGDGAGCPNHHGGKKSGMAAKGDPVDVVTGRVFTIPAVDLELPGPLPLSIVRSYTTAAFERDVGLGFGWSHSLAWEIEVRQRILRVWTDDGPVDLDTMPVGAGVAGPHGWVLAREERGFVLDTGDGRWYVFAEAAGKRFRLTAIKDRYNNEIRLSYREGVLTEITDSVGRIVRVRRAPDGRIGAFEIKNARERGVWVPFAQYSYDAAGDLTSATDADGYTTRYTYQEHLLTSHTSPTGLTFSFRYDDRRRCVETWGAYGDGRDRSLAEDAPTHLADGRTVARGIYHCKLEFGEGGYVEVADSITVHRYFGNRFGKLDKAVSAGAVFSRTYDEHGHLRTFVDPVGAMTVWQRDRLGRELSITDPLGRMTKIERDPDGHIRRAIDPAGGITEIGRTPDGLIWTDPLGAVFQVRQDAHGRLIETVAPNGGRTTYRYDDLGNMVEKTDALGGKTQLAYDYWGRCRSIRDTSGAVLSYTYDNRGNLTGVHRPDGGTTRYEYDGMGDCTAVLQPNQQVTRFVRGGFHKLCEVHKPNGEITRFRYNREGRLVEIQNALGERHRIELDAAGMVTSERGFDGRVSRTKYDYNGRVISFQNAAGERTEYTYDLAGQLVARTFDDGSVERFTYDDRGDVIAAESPAGSFTYERNAVGWVVSETQIVGGEAATVRRTFDLMGDVVERTTSFGHSARWIRNVGGLAEKVILDGRDEVRVAYDAAGREVCRALPRGGRIESAWDLMDRLVERRVCAPSSRVHVGPNEPEWVGPAPASVTVHQAYRYSPASELVEAWDQAYGTRRFEYDPASQILANVPEHERAELFRYDACGNVFDVAAGKKDRSYGPGNRLLRKGDTELLWDDDARLKETRARTPAGALEVTQYTWDARGLLQSVERADGTVVEFSYDPDARRVAKRVSRRLSTGELRPESATRFVWDGAELVHEIRQVTGDAAAHAVPTVDARTYVFEAGAPWAQRAGEGEWYHYLNDEIGTPERLVGPDGAVACELRRSAWGKVEPARNALAPVSTPIRFRGQYWDEEIGLCYNRNRYYDPEAGRYISADPIGVLGGLNGFAYAENQPTRLVDPDGLMAKAGTEIETAGGKTHHGSSTFGGALDPALQTAVADAHKKFDDGKVAGPAPSSAGHCAEIDALNNLAKDIRQDRKQNGKTLKDPAAEDIEIRKELQKQVKEGKMTTTDRRGKLMDPCKFCAQVLRELGLHPANNGGTGKKNGVIGSDGKAWNGNVWLAGRSVPFRTAPSSTPPFEGT